MADNTPITSIDDQSITLFAEPTVKANLDKVIVACVLAFVIHASAQHSNSTGTSVDSPSVSGQAKPVTPRDVLPVKLQIRDTISSANAKVGQIVLFEVTLPVLVDGKPLIATGAQAQGHVSKAKRRGHNGREGQLALTLDKVQSADGAVLPLFSATLQKGTGRGEPIFGPCTFPFPADPVGLFRKGQDVVIPKGTELTAEITNPHS